MAEGTTVQISENIWAIQSPYENYWVRSYLVLGETAALVDTGLASTAEAIRRLVELLGRPRVIAAIHTHGHWDHIGAASAVREEVGCLIAAHRADAAMISSYEENDRRFLNRFPELPPSEAERKAVYQHLGPETRVDLQLIGGERLELGNDVALEVVHMTGHTPGSLGVFEPCSGALLTGDSLAGRGPFNTLAQYEDAVAYRETVLRTMRLPVHKLLTAHFEPIAGSDVPRFLADCLAEIERIEGCVCEVAADGRDVVDVAQEVCRKMNKPFTMQSLLTTSAHLTKQEITNQERDQ